LWIGIKYGNFKRLMTIVTGAAIVLSEAKFSLR
jgi:hypothetical protein